MIDVDRWYSLIDVHVRLPRSTLRLSTFSKLLAYLASYPDSIILVSFPDPRPGTRLKNDHTWLTMATQSDKLQQAIDLSSITSDLSFVASSESSQSSSSVGQAGSSDVAQSLLPRARRGTETLVLAT